MKYQTPSPHSRQQFPSLVQRCFLPDPSCLLLARRRKEGLLLGKRKKGRRKEELWSRHFHPLPVALALRSGGYPSLEQYQIPNLLPLLFSTICSAKQGKVDARAILPSFPSPDWDPGRNEWDAATQSVGPSEAGGPGLSWLAPILQKDRLPMLSRKPLSSNYCMFSKSSMSVVHLLKYLSVAWYMFFLWCRLFSEYV